MLAVAGGGRGGCGGGGGAHKGEAVPVAAQHNAGHIACWMVCTMKARKS